MIKLKVTEQGVTLPKKYFPDVQVVEILLTEDGVIVKSKIRQVQQNWSQEFMQFQGIEDGIDFSSYRNELLEPKEDIFE